MKEKSLKRKTARRQFKMPTAPHVNMKRQNPQPSTINQCRVCLMEGFILMSDYLVEMINLFTQIGVKQDDLLPQFLCESCHDLVIAAVLLRDIARESDCTLKKKPLNKKSTLNLSNTKMLARNLLQKLAQSSIFPPGLDNETKELKNNNVDENDSDIHFNEQSDLDVMSCLKCDADFLDPLSFKAHLAMHQSESHKEEVTRKQKEHPAITFDEHKVLQHVSNINSVIIPKLTELVYETKQSPYLMEYKTDIRHKQRVKNLNKKLRQIAVLTESIKAAKSPSNVNIKFTCMANVSRKEDISKPQMVVYKNECFFVCNEVQDFHVHAHKHLVNRVLEDESVIDNNIRKKEITQTNSSQSDFTPENIESNNSTEQKSDKQYVKTQDFDNVNGSSADCKDEDDYSDEGPSTIEPSSLTTKTLIKTEDDTEVFNCKECSNDYVGFTSYIDHVQSHLRDKYPIEVRQWTCKICMNDFKNKQYIHFIMHMARHIVCRICNNEKTAEELRSVRQICQQHKKLVYNSNRRRLEAKVLCETCGKRFSISDYKKHIFTHKKELRFQCNECPFRTTRLALIKTHMGYRHTEKRFVCDKCDRSFAASGNLSSHQKYAHSSKRYVCSVERCKRKCISQAALNNHVRNEHMGGKEWKCTHCEQKFHKRTAYYRHLLIKHKTTITKGYPEYLRKDRKKP